MSKRMLVDASHQEETRVVVLDGNRVEEFDYESASKRPLKGNIYLAKVTRVEPSLQACFIEYGGNRHGFLAFSEIHPDYYQIPTADRQALLAATREVERHDDDADEVADTRTPHGPQNADSHETGTQSRVRSESQRNPDETTTTEEDQSGPADDDGVVEIVTSDDDDVWVHDPEDDAEPTGAPALSNGSTSPASDDQNDGDIASNNQLFSEALDVTAPDHDGELPATGDAGDPEPATRADDVMEELPRREHRSYRRYKIQEVIKRRQVLLIQVVKEERGNKGAALTTYLSLAGRYCVLMPNTDRGGGISRKISNVADRRKLKEMAVELEVPEGMGVIIRTAGANRTRQEIRRDFEYLLRQWDSVRDLTLRSSAPTLVYEEGNLIKRTIRDLFSKDVDEVLVEGELGYAEAHGFMTMLMPSHAEAVKHYSDVVPMFQRYGVEAALDSMFNPTVRLRSGGYIVINQTEALVAVDVNSGKSTREHHIEDTALKTNLEASEEIARQLRLRDLAGLVVIDFIDMEEHRNNRSVEKRLKDCLRHDRARIQLGRISPFGLLEMSRQRLRAGMVEGATTACPHCEGRGVIRSVGSMALRVLRAVEEFCQHEKVQAATLRVPPEVALYILNHKRAQLTAIEDRNGAYIYIESQQSLAASAYEIERGASVPFEPRKPALTAVTVESELEVNDDTEIDDAQDDEDAIAPSLPTTADDGSKPVETAQGETAESQRRKRRRRGRGRDRDREPRAPIAPGMGPQPDLPPTPPSLEVQTARLNGIETDSVDEGESDDGDGDDVIDTAANPAATTETADGQRRRRRRGRRGRRGRKFDEGSPQEHAASVIGHLPTPAEALDAPEWPRTGGFDTRPGKLPPAARRSESFEPYSGLASQPTAPAQESETRSSEPKQERSSIATFFGFGPKAEEPKPVEGNENPRKGWWQKRSEG